MNRSLKTTFLLAFFVWGCAKMDNIPTSNNKIIDKKMNLNNNKNYKVKSFSNISQESCDSSGGYSSYVDSGRVEYPYDSYYVGGDNGKAICLIDSETESRTCLSLTDWKYYSGRSFNDYYSLLAYLKTKSQPVQEYAGCYFSDPAPPQDDNDSYGNPYGNRDESGSGTYQPYGSDGMHTLSVNLNNSNCSN